MIRKPFSLCIALVAFGLAAESGRALAASRPNQEKVTVQGPYTIREHMNDTSIGRGEIEKVSVSQSVSYADLNLSKPADVAVLKDRIQRAARDNCNKLRRSYPEFSYRAPRPDCVADAVRPTNARVDQIAMLSR
jgi:UrcA family protein